MFVHAARCCAAFALCALLATPLAEAAAPAPFVGIEPARPAPGSGAGIVFVDALKQAAPWSSARPLHLDAAGNVTALLPGQSADATVYTGERYPAGDYTLLYDGRATFAVSGGSIVAEEPGRAVVRVAPNDGSGLHLRLLATDPADYARNVRLILPGFETTYAREPFYPAFVRSFAGRDVIRFAAWMQPDVAAPAVWPARPSVDRFTQAMPGGVAPEYEIALANATGATPWFSVPAGATNSYVSQLAALVHRTLDPRLNAIFQYGDAVWQSGTPGHAWAASAGRNAGLAADPESAAFEWYVTRSLHVFTLVERAFGNDAWRVTRVVAGPAADAAGIDLDRALIARVAGRADAFAFASRTDAASDGSAVVLARAQRLAPIELGGRDAASFTAWRTAGGRLWVGPAVAGVTGAERPPWMPSGSLHIAAYRAPLESHHRRQHAPVVAAFVAPRDAPPASGPALDVTVGTPPERIDLAAEGNEDWVDWSSGAHGRRAPHGDRAIRPLAGALALDVPADPSTRILRVYVRADRALPVLRAALSDGAAPAAARTFESRFGVSHAVYTVSYRAGSRGARLHVTLAPGVENGRAVLEAATLDSEAIPAVLPSPSDVTTYHNDLSRSGWNPNEYYLNERTVASSAFGLKQTLTVAGDVLAQPLYVAGYNLGSKLGVHDLLIVATEHDVLYEFDADSGALLQTLSVGTPQSSNDVGCSDIEPEYGITSTPVIDRASGTIYFVAATEPSSGNFQAALYAADLATLKLKGTPTVISATANMSGGGTISFNPAYQQNRTGLVLNNGTIYVGIGSHCDFDFGGITGWMLAYDTSLKQTAAMTMGEDTNGGLLNSIWMTGFASAVDSSGNLIAVTGNGTNDAYAGGTNYGESAVKIAPDLSKILSSFTPSGYETLDANDTDFGSGGIIVLPPSAGKYPHMAVAMGKSSVMYLLNTDSLGGLGHFIQHYNVPGGGVWGGPAFYNGPLGRFVYYQTDGQGLSVYQQTVDAGGTPHLYLESQRGASPAGYGGSLPIGSSWGQKPLTGVVWLVQRNSTLRLEAYSARESTRMLFAGNAGTWSNPENNGFVTPLVANGRVYVPADGTISVFGLH
jgi:hypothetical protein